MSSLPPSLKIDAARRSHAYVISIEGVLDQAACPAFESALAEAERSRASRIVVDLDRLNLIDACGLQTLLTASRRSVSNGNRLRLTPGTGEVASMFSLTMLDLTLPFTEPLGPRQSQPARESVEV